jgi:23S rRNA (pseudouridine1915-N3)-methyltransferase
LKIVLLTIVSNNEPWFQKARELYTEKINYMAKFEVEAIKASKIDRANAEQKKKLESEMLLKALKPNDFVVLLDERGKALDSLRLAQWFERENSQSTSKRMVFIIGGAFGVDEDIKKRAQLTLQLGPWTLNHLVAQTVLLEQIYRMLTIIKGLPYHNA